MQGDESHWHCLPDRSRSGYKVQLAPVVEALRAMLAQVGPLPLIVRSSSLLEDNFATSFAGKYESIFCPNQGAPEENLADLTRAFSLVYASLFSH